MSAIRGVQAKHDEVVHWYIEECFARDNKEECHLRRSYKERPEESMGNGVAIRLLRPLI